MTRVGFPRPPIRRVNLSGWTQGAVLVIVGGVAMGSAPVVFIGAVLIAIRLVAVRWPRRVLDDLVYERSISPRNTVVGEPVEVSLSLWNRSRLPIAWAGSDDTMSPHLVAEGRAVELSTAGPMRPFERVTRRVRVVPTRRGVHEVGPVRVRVAEHFGTQVPHVDVPDEPVTILARPLMVPVVGRSPQFAPLAEVRARQSLFVDPALFAGVQPYQPGDPLRTIHWRASARDRGLRSKRFEPALSRQQILVLDVQTIEGPYWMLDYDEDLFEDLCVATASLARRLIGTDVACGFAAAGFTRTTQRFAYLPPRADRSQIGRVGDLLARLSPESSGPLTQLLAWLPQRVARGTTITVISGRSPLASAAVVRRLKQSGFPIHFVAFGPGAAEVKEARLAGVSSSAASVARERRRPHSIVLDVAA